MTRDLQFRCYLSDGEIVDVDARDKGEARETAEAMTSAKVRRVAQVPAAVAPVLPGYLVAEYAAR